MSRSSWKFQVVVQDGSRIYNQNLKSVVLARKEGRQSVQRLSIFEPVPFCSFVFWVCDNFFGESLIFLWFKICCRWSLLDLSMITQSLREDSLYIKWKTGSFRTKIKIYYWMYNWFNVFKMFYAFRISDL